MGEEEERSQPVSMLLDTFSSTLFFSLFPALSFSFSALDAGRVCSVSSCIALLGSRNILRPFAATKCRRHYLLSSLPSSFFFFLLLLFPLFLLILCLFFFFFLYFYFYNYSRRFSFFFLSCRSLRVKDRSQGGRSF